MRVVACFIQPAVRAAAFAFILLFIPAGGVFGSQPPALSAYNEGNTRYEKGDYASARDAYLTSIENGARDAALYYNLGNAYVKLTNYGRAVLFYERALRVDGNDGDAEANLEYVRARLKDRIETPEVNPLLKLFFFYHYYFSLATQAIVVLVLFSLAMLSSVFFVLARTESGKTRALVGIVAFFVMTALVGVSLSLRYTTVYHNEYAVILADEVIARSEPRENAAESFKIHEGTKVEVIRKTDTWCEVLLPNNLLGWVTRDTLESI